MSRKTIPTGMQSMMEIHLPQVLVCKKCCEPFVLVGAGVELVGESKIGYRHRCGAINELQFIKTDESNRAVFGVVGVVPTTYGQGGIAA
jgi:hypothetical protein